MTTSRAYDLKPTGGRQKSFYGKAQVLENPDGTKTLVSYQTNIMTYDPATGKLTRHWPDYSWKAQHGRDWTPTTGRHIAEFSEQMTGQRLNKAGFMALEGGPA